MDTLLRPVKDEPAMIALACGLWHLTRLTLRWIAAYLVVEVAAMIWVGV